MKTSAFPVLTTDRLQLRPLAADDRDMVLYLHSSSEVNAFVEREQLKSLDQADAFIQKIRNGCAAAEWYYWCLNLKQNPAMIGSICLWNLSADRFTAELGDELAPEHQGQGYMTEALQRVINYAFEILEMDSLEAYTHRDNDASTRLLVRNAFKRKKRHSDEFNQDNVIFVRHRIEHPG